jgi:hypothetical protein
VTVFRKRIDVIAVVELSSRFDFQALSVEVGSEHDLAREPLPLICLFSHHSTVSRIKPNRDRAPVPEPFVYGR